MSNSNKPGVCETQNFSLLFVLLDTHICKFKLKGANCIVNSLFHFPASEGGSESEDSSEKGEEESKPKVHKKKSNLFVIKMTINFYSDPFQY